MKVVRVLLYALLGVVALVLVIAVVGLAPVDDTPYQQMPYYQQTRERLTALPTPPPPTAALRAGWAKVNITPNFTTATGGYGARQGKHWRVVNDSIYVRAVMLDNGSNRVAIVGLDLLITPPTVVEALKKRLPEVGMRWENVYMGAIHSHNSMGGWAPGLVGQLIAGGYDERVVPLITNGILSAIKKAQATMAPAELGYGQANGSDLIYNRMASSGPTGPLDGTVRLLKLKKQTGQTALLCTFAGHATLYDDTASDYLSRDYPGALVDRLEKNDVDFALFMAGAVGSTGPEVKAPNDAAEIKAYSGALVSRIEQTLPAIKTRTDSTLAMLSLPLGLREPNPRVLGNWRVRPWLFYAIYGDYPSDLKALHIGNTVMLGTPCDFSGELAVGLLPVARRDSVNLMITSFEGGYVGYITPDRYYDRQQYEVREMNWFGPYNGAYFSEMMARLLDRIARK
ncbi:neutral/alkaline non-lysosomal ceramidase N-terminal domain-containing protein [Spirosoma rhododendri]|uniref:Neutral/alkaline non-lysosomal ceramidase N-terminal domain-containing protein n=1 Tax=Spirosoma rhododendri TaxID=2728024 RepID=A0A7L5DL03_9BACT|nr:neutral/alkaline non-lysosomal ceramidase N-terminal domain-containing protein [Spirosoma rhododendri]QJD78765.1 hypothetical protein HH216_10235 [Spirosoma rhododendri]